MRSLCLMHGLIPPNFSPIPSLACYLYGLNPPWSSTHYLYGLTAPTFSVLPTPSSIRYLHGLTPPISYFFSFLHCRSFFFQRIKTHHSQFKIVLWSRLGVAHRLIAPPSTRRFFSFSISVFSLSHLTVSYFELICTVKSRKNGCKGSMSGFPLLPS